MLMAMPAFVFYSGIESVVTTALYFLIGTSSIIAGLLLPGERSSRPERILSAILLSASFLFAGSYLQRIQPYPFSMTWSEGNHLWQASLFYGSGTGIPTAEISISNYVTPGLYGLRGVPFLFGIKSLSIYRAWEAVLWLVPPLVFSWAVSCWANIERWRIWLFSLWGALFLAQGPVYAPLLLGGAVALLAARDQRLHVQRAGMLIGNLIAGLARWTWMFTPGLWGMLVLGFRIRPEKTTSPPQWLSLAWDAVAVLSGAGLSQWLSYLITGHAPLTYFTTISHPLLWYRLLSNETYPPGIIRGLMLVAGPLVAALCVAAWSKRDRLNPWVVALTSLLTAGFALSGLVISVKIGGGSNLHNLDMLLATLVLLTGMSIAGRTVEELAAGWQRTVAWVGVLVLLALPVTQVVNNIERLSLPDVAATNEAYALLDAILQSVTPDEEVLFIDQRQILVTENYPSLHWDPEFEQVELMDRALASDDVYLADFYSQLRAERYRWIICDPQPMVYKGRSGPFGEENDAWVTAVTIPLLETYQARYTLDDVGIWIMEPRTEVAPDGTR